MADKYAQDGKDVRKYDSIIDVFDAFTNNASTTTLELFLIYTKDFTFLRLHFW
jgi:hypothetical protein